VLEIVRRLLRANLAGPLIAFMLVLTTAGSTTDRFFDGGNLANLALQVSVVSIVAIGSTIVILTAGIDLSPGSMIALLSMTLALLLKNCGLGSGAAILLLLTLGGLLGALNGIITAYLRIPSFIATLAAYSALRGLAFIPTGGAPVFSLSEGLSQVFYGSLFGIPLPVYYVLFSYLVAAIFLGATPAGRAIYAVGGNSVAARLSGIQVARIQCLAFSIAGVASAAGAVLFAARLNSGSPNYGNGMELQAIASSVIGGASLSGGRGNILGTLVGALILAVVQNAMNLNGIGSSLQAVIIGAIILLAVGIDRWRVELGRIILASVPQCARSKSE
jgi:ribose transport system permease protein